MPPPPQPIKVLPRQSAWYHERLTNRVSRPLLGEYGAAVRDTRTASAAVEAVGRIDTVDLLASQKVTDTIAAQGRTLAEYHKKRTTKTFLGALRVDVSPALTDGPINAYLDTWEATNNALLEKAAFQSRARVMEKLARGAVSEAEIDAILAAERLRLWRKMRLISRDQTAKAIGHMTALRHEQLGVREYIWRTRLDERVRPSHALLSGTQQKWDNPPAVGHPGYDIQCRCMAVPVITRSEAVLNQLDYQQQGLLRLDELMFGQRAGLLDLNSTQRFVADGLRDITLQRARALQAMGIRQAEYDALRDLFGASADNVVVSNELVATALESANDNIIAAARQTAKRALDEAVSASEGMAVGQAALSAQREVAERLTASTESITTVQTGLARRTASAESELARNREIAEVAQEAANKAAEEATNILGVDVVRDRRAAARAAVKAEARRERDRVINLKPFEQAGTLRGQPLYMNVDTGERWMFEVMTKERARNRILMARLYEAAGVRVAELHVGKLGKRVGLATKAVEDGRVIGRNIAASAGAREGAGADVWLRNITVLGNDYDGIVDQHGSAVRAYVSGGLRFGEDGKALGKAFSDDVSDAWNAVMRQDVFADLTAEEFDALAAKVISVTDEQITDIVTEYGPGSAAVRSGLIERLIARREGVGARARARVGALPTPPSESSIAGMAFAPDPDIDFVDTAAMTDLGIVPGTQGGRRLRNANTGEEWYVREITTVGQVEPVDAMREHILVSALYREAGIDASTAVQSHISGRPAIAIKWRDELANPIQYDGGAAGGFAVDTWLGQSAIGSSGNRVLRTADGSTFRADIGGGLSWKGTRSVEWRTLREQEWGGEGLFGKLSAKEIAESAEVLDAIPDSRIREIAAELGNGDIAARARTGDMLVRRKAVIRARARAMNDRINGVPIPDEEVGRYYRELDQLEDEWLRGTNDDYRRYKDALANGDKGYFENRPSVTSARDRMIAYEQRMDDVLPPLNVSAMPVAELSDADLLVHLRRLDGWVEIDDSQSVIVARERARAEVDRRSIVTPAPEAETVDVVEAVVTEGAVIREDYDPLDVGGFLPMGWRTSNRWMDPTTNREWYIAREQFSAPSPPIAYEMRAFSEQLPVQVRSGSSAAELLGTLLYREAGVDVADVRLVGASDDLAQGFARAIPEGAIEVLPTDVADVAGITDAAVIDIWLGNGTIGYPNRVLRTADGRAIRYDMGDLVTAGAEGTAAASTESAGQLWNAVLVDDLVPNSPYRHITTADLVAGGERLALVTEERIRAIVRALRPTEEWLEEALIARRIDVLARVLREADANDIAVSARFRSVVGDYSPVEVTSPAVRPVPSRYTPPDPRSDSYVVQAGYGTSPSSYPTDVRLDIAVEPELVPLLDDFPAEYLERDFLKDRFGPDSLRHILEDIEVHLDIVARTSRRSGLRGANDAMTAAAWARRQADELLRMAGAAAELADDLDAALMVLGPSKDYAILHANKTAEMARYGNQLAEAARREANRINNLGVNDVLSEAFTTRPTPVPPQPLLNLTDQIDNWVHEALRGEDPIALRYVLVAQRDQLHAQRGALWRHVEVSDVRTKALENIEEELRILGAIWDSSIAGRSEEALNAVEELTVARGRTRRSIDELTDHFGREYVRYDSYFTDPLVIENAVPDIPAWRYPTQMPEPLPEPRGAFAVRVDDDYIPLRGDDMWLGNLDAAFELPAGASGTVYRDSATGLAWVVRPVRAQSGREAAAAAIYSELGIPSAGVRYSFVDGKRVLATEWAYGDTLDAASLAVNRSVADGFAVDVLLGNRRAADPQSYVVPPSNVGSAVRTDMQRVLDLDDGFSAELGDWAAYAVDGLEANEMVNSAAVLARIRDDRLRELITAHVPGEDGLRLAETVIERRREIMLRAMREARELDIPLPREVRAFTSNDTAMPNVWPAAQRVSSDLVTDEIEDLIGVVRERDSVFRSVVNEMSENERIRTRLSEEYNDLKSWRAANGTSPALDAEIKLLLDKINESQKEWDRLRVAVGNHLGPDLTVDTYRLYDRLDEVLPPLEVDNIPRIDAADLIPAERAGPMRGIDEGSLMENLDTGSEYYVKHIDPYTFGDHPASNLLSTDPDDLGRIFEDNARLQIVTGMIYREAGFDVPDMFLTAKHYDAGVNTPLIPSIASRYIDDLSPVGANYSDVADGFVLDALVGSWDLSRPHNIAVSPGGKVIRFDFGGALGFEPRGWMRDFGDSVTEWRYLRTGGFGMQQEFKDLTTRQLLRSGARMLSIPESRLRQIMAENGPRSPSMNARITESLIARREDLRRRLRQIADELDDVERAAVADELAYILPTPQLPFPSTAVARESISEAAERGRYVSYSPSQIATGNPADEIRVTAFDDWSDRGSTERLVERARESRAYIDLNKFGVSEIQLNIPNNLDVRVANGKPPTLAQNEIETKISNLMGELSESDDMLLWRAADGTQRYEVGKHYTLGAQTSFDLSPNNAVGLYDNEVDTIFEIHAQNGTRAMLYGAEAKGVLDRGQLFVVDAVYDNISLNAHEIGYFTHKPRPINVGQYVVVRMGVGVKTPVAAVQAVDSLESVLSPFRNAVLSLARQLRRHADDTDAFVLAEDAFSKQVDAITAGVQGAVSRLDRDTLTEIGDTVAELTDYPDSLANVARIANKLEGFIGRVMEDAVVRTGTPLTATRMDRLRYGVGELVTSLQTNASADTVARYRDALLGDALTLWNETSAEHRPLLQRLMIEVDRADGPDTDLGLAYSRTIERIRGVDVDDRLEDAASIPVAAARAMSETTGTPEWMVGLRDAVDSFAQVRIRSEVGTALLSLRREADRIMHMIDDPVIRSEAITALRNEADRIASLERGGVDFVAIANEMKLLESERTRHREWQYLARLLDGEEPPVEFIDGSYRPRSAPSVAADGKLAEWDDLNESLDDLLYDDVTEPPDEVWNAWYNSARHVDNEDLPDGVTRFLDGGDSSFDPEQFTRNQRAGIVWSTDELEVDLDLLQSMQRFEEGDIMPMWYGGSDAAELIQDGGGVLEAHTSAQIHAFYALDEAANSTDRILLELHGQAGMEAITAGEVEDGIVLLRRGQRVVVDRVYNNVEIAGEQIDSYVIARVEGIASADPNITPLPQRAAAPRAVVDDAVLPPAEAVAAKVEEPIRIGGGAGGQNYTDIPTNSVQPGKGLRVGGEAETEWQFVLRERSGGGGGEWAQVELLAGDLYRAGGVRVPDAKQTLLYNTNNGVAYRAIPGVKRVTSAAEAEQFRTQLAVDAWLGNKSITDSIDSLADMQAAAVVDGEVIRVDMSRTLAWSNTGEELDLNTYLPATVDDLFHMRVPVGKANYDNALADVSLYDIRVGAEGIEQLSDSQIRDIVNARLQGGSYKAVNYPTAMANRLIARRDNLIARGQAHKWANGFEALPTDGDLNEVMPYLVVRAEERALDDIRLALRNGEIDTAALNVDGLTVDNYLSVLPPKAQEGYQYVLNMHRLSNELHAETGMRVGSAISHDLTDEIYNIVNRSDPDMIDELRLRPAIREAAEVVEDTPVDTVVVETVIPSSEPIFDVPTVGMSDLNKVQGDYYNNLLGDAYIDPADGRRYLVMEPPVPADAAEGAADMVIENMLVANRIYRELNIPVPTVVRTVRDGKPAVRFDWLPSSDEVSAAVLRATPRVYDGFAVDLLLGNLNVMDGGAIRRMADGNVIRLNQWATLQYGKAGRERGLSKVVSDWDNLRNRKLSQAGSVYEAITDADMVRSADLLATLSDDRLREIVKVIGSGDGALAETILARKRDIMRRAERLRASLPEQLGPAEEVITPLRAVESAAAAEPEEALSLSAQLVDTQQELVTRHARLRQITDQYHGALGNITDPDVAAELVQIQTRITGLETRVVELQSAVRIGVDPDDASAAVARAMQRRGVVTAGDFEDIDADLGLLAWHRRESQIRNEVQRLADEMTDLNAVNDLVVSRIGELGVWRSMRERIGASGGVFPDDLIERYRRTKIEVDIYRRRREVLLSNVLDDEYGIAVHPSTIPRTLDGDPPMGPIMGDSAASVENAYPLPSNSDLQRYENIMLKSGVSAEDARIDLNVAAPIPDQFELGAMWLENVTHNFSGLPNKFLDEMEEAKSALIQSIESMRSNPTREAAENFYSSMQIYRYNREYLAEIAENSAFPVPILRRGIEDTPDWIVPISGETRVWMDIPEYRDKWIRIENIKVEKRAATILKDTNVLKELNAEELRLNNELTLLRSTVPDRAEIRNFNQQLGQLYERGNLEYAPRAYTATGDVRLDNAAEEMRTAMDKQQSAFHRLIDLLNRSEVDTNNERLVGMTNTVDEATRELWESSRAARAAHDRYNAAAVEFDPSIDVDIWNLPEMPTSTRMVGWADAVAEDGMLRNKFSNTPSRETLIGAVTRDDGNARNWYLSEPGFSLYQVAKKRNRANGPLRPTGAIAEKWISDYADIGEKMRKIMRGEGNVAPVLLRKDQAVLASVIQETVEVQRPGVVYRSLQLPDNRKFTPGEVIQFESPQAAAGEYDIYGMTLNTKWEMNLQKGTRAALFNEGEVEVLIESGALFVIDDVITEGLPEGVTQHVVGRVYPPPWRAEGLTRGIGSIDREAEVSAGAAVVEAARVVARARLLALVQG